MNALDAALKITAYAPQFSQVLKNKLKKKGYMDDEIEPVIQTLTNAEIINDEQLALLYAAELVRNKLYGSMMVRAKLYEKGIAKEFIETAVDAAYRENADEYATCLAYLKKTRIDPSEYPYDKLCRKLSTHGFSGGTIRRVVKSDIEIDNDI